MYIEQLINKNKDLRLYLPPGLTIILLTLINTIASVGIDDKLMFDNMIDEMGETFTFAYIVGQVFLFLILLLIWVKFAQNQSITSLTTSRSKIDWNRVFFSFSLWAFISIVIILVNYFLNPQNFVWNFVPEKFFPFMLVAIIFLPFQSSFEEYLLRGHLMQGIGLATQTRWLPLVISSILFGLFHLSNPEVDELGLVFMVYYIGMGLFLGIITLMDNGLELALGFHTANNIVVALLVTSDWTVLRTHAILKDVGEPKVNIEVTFLFFLILPLLLFIFSKKYKWTNWKKNLIGWYEVKKNN